MDCFLKEGSTTRFVCETEEFYPQPDGSCTVVLRVYRCLAGYRQLDGTQIYELWRWDGAELEFLKVLDVTVRGYGKMRG